MRSFSIRFCIFVQISIMITVIIFELHKTRRGINMANSITKRKDGRFMGRFIIGHGDDGKAIYQYVYGNSYDEALKKVQIGMEVESRYRSGKEITISEVYHEWIAAVANRVKESTYVNYCTKFEKHILPEFGSIACSAVSAGKLNSFINKKLADGLSASYIRDIITVFKSMLLYAREEYDLRISLKNVILPKVDKKPIRKISDDEQMKLVEYLKSNMDLTSLGIMISLYMGLRIGELCGLTWADIDLAHKILYVRRTVQRISSHGNGDKKTKIVVSTPKSDTSFRMITIPDFLAEYLRMFKSDDDFYLLSGSRKIVEPRSYQYRYKKVLSEANTETYHYHQLRHTFATNCVENGFDIKTLSIVLGHKTANITLNRYVHPDLIHERKMMNKLALLF